MRELQQSDRKYGVWYGRGMNGDPDLVSTLQSLCEIEVSMSMGDEKKEVVVVKRGGGQCFCMMVKLKLPKK